MNISNSKKYTVVVTDWETGEETVYGPFANEGIALRKAQRIAEKRGWLKVSDYHYVLYKGNGTSAEISVDSEATDIQIVEAGQHEGESFVLTTVNDQIFAKVAVEYYMPFPPNIVKVLKFALQHTTKKRILVQYTYTAIHTTVIIDHDSEREKTAIDIVRFDTVQKYSSDLLSTSEIEKVLMHMFYGA